MSGLTIVSWCHEPPDQCDPCAGLQAYCFNPSGSVNGRVVGADQPPNVPSTLQLYIRGQYIDPNTLIGTGQFINEPFVSVTPVVTVTSKYNFYDGLHHWTIWSGGWSAAEGQVVAASGVPGKILLLTTSLVEGLLGAPLGGNGTLDGSFQIIGNSFLGTPSLAISTGSFLPIEFYRTAS
jgi:hypothetical protein